MRVSKVWWVVFGGGWRIGFRLGKGFIMNIFLNCIILFWCVKYRLLCVGGWKYFYFSLLLVIMIWMLWDCEFGLLICIFELGNVWGDGLG